MKRFFLTFAMMGLMLVSCDNKPKTVDHDTGQNATQSTDATTQVSAEDGGPGFEKIAESKGFVTAVGKDYSDPKATKGGTFRYHMENYPNVLRPYGPNANTVDVRGVTDPIYLVHLIDYNFETEKWERGLANYWKFENDDKRLTIRLNPNAKFSDGTPLTVDDVIASHEFLMSEDLGDPIISETEKKYTMTKLSDYLLQIDVQDYEFTIWYILNPYIFPENYLSKISPREFVEKYASDTMPGLGGYDFDKEKSKNQELVVLKRKADWWGYEYPEWKNTHNFDNIEIKIIREAKVALETLKKGDIDLYDMRSHIDQWYGDMLKENTTLDVLKRNLIVKKVLFNGNPKSRSYIEFNIRQKPFDNVLIRKAISLAFNKDLAIDKVDHNDTVKYYSHNPLSAWVSPNLEQYQYDPETASKLLDEAGYNITDEDGVRKNAAGERLEFEVFMYTQTRNETIHTMLQEDLKKVGIKINLVKTDFPNVVKRIDDRSFNFVRIGFTCNFYPEYQLELLSSLADQPNSNNATGFKSPEVDKLIDEFLKERDVQKRHEISNKIDEIVVDSRVYMHLFTFPFTTKYSVLNRFGMPVSFSQGNYFFDPFVRYWYVDKEKDVLYEKAKTDASVTLEEGNLIQDPFNLKPAGYNIAQY